MRRTLLDPWVFGALLTGSHYLDSAIAYIRAPTLARLGRPVALRVVLGPALLLAAGPRSQAPIYYCWEPPARFRIVGDGPERPALEAQAQRLALRGAEFLGFVPGGELAFHDAAADVLTHAARLETFGLTVLEAAMQGRPAVVVDEGGPRETILEGESGFLVPPTAQGLARGLLAMLAESSGSSRMGAAARARVLERYRWEAAAVALEGASS